MNIAQRLRAIRTQKGLNQMQVAGYLGTTQQQYSKYENETHEIPVRHVVALCKLYGVSSDWLLGLSEQEDV